MGSYTMPRNTTVTFTETIQPTNGQQQVLGSNGISGWEFWLTIKNDPADLDASAVVQKLPAAWSVSQTGNTTTPGIAFVTLQPADTLNVPLHQVTCQYDVRARDTNGNIFTLESGTWTFTPNITQATS